MAALSPRRLAALLPPGLHEAGWALARVTEAGLADADAGLAAIRRIGATAIPAASADYPEMVHRHLGASAPPLLFVLGNDRLLHEPAAAVVGARDPTAAGHDLGAQCARVFAERGIPVVSGGAKGVDTAAHHAALAAGGTTIVVLPQGLAGYWPTTALQAGLHADAAVIVSEFPPHTPWEVHAAVTRNATISAFGRVVCVIEPKKTGGSIRTARLAIGQGKRVFIHCAPGHDGVRDILRGARVAELPADKGQLASALLEAWQQPEEVGEGQLFL